MPALTRNRRPATAGEPERLRGWAPNDRRGLRVGAWANLPGVRDRRTGRASWPSRVPIERDSVPNYLTTLLTRRRAGRRRPRVRARAAHRPRGHRRRPGRHHFRRPAPAPAAAVNRPRSRATEPAGWRTRSPPTAATWPALTAPLLTDTAYAVIGLQAAGVGRHATARALRGWRASWRRAERPDNTDDPGRLAYSSWPRVSAGQGSVALRREQPANDLVARLLATARTTGPDRGLFGAADPTYDGPIRQGLALAALKAAGVPVGTAAVAAGINWLTRQQCANGLWESYRASTARACPAADPNTFSGPDTNSTGLAVQGLAAYGKHPRQWPVLTALAAVQSATAASRISPRPARARTRTRRR